jgi:hypothetical protein
MRQIRWRALLIAGLHMLLCGQAGDITPADEARAVRELAACSTIGRRLPLAERAALVPGQSERLRKIMSDAKKKVAETASERPQFQKGKVAGPDAQAALEGWFRETVAIFPSDRPQDRTFCSGVLLHNGAVLTAAHCVCDLGLARPIADLAEGGPFVAFGRDMTQVKVRDRGPLRWEIDPQRTRLLDPSYCKARTTVGEAAVRGNDVALVFLSARNGPPLDGSGIQVEPGPPDLAWLPTNTRIAPARIAPMSLVFSQALERLIVAGFGYNDVFRDARIKTFGCVEVLSRICGYPSSREQFRCLGGQETVLRDSEQRADTCFGDSGGPAFAVVDTGKEFAYYLAGITSRAIDRGGACGPGGVYTLITPRIIDWLRREGAIGIHDDPNQ